MCGITRLEDAIAASQAGADALGFVFYEKSPRYVSPDTADEIIRALPPFMTAVGLFVNESSDEIQKIMSRVRLDVLQFHGDETPEFCRQFKRPYLKAVRVKDDTPLYEIADDFHDAQGLLLDSYVPGVPGGTGKAFNWSLIPKNLPLPFLLAGGLSPENVSEAIEAVSPYGVDVSGGIERKKGIKDSEKIKAFLRGVYSG